MDRRNFLAFIPTLSAIPFIGKNIEKTESGIFIESPKPAIVSTLNKSPINSFLDLEVRLFANGRHVGNAYIENVSMHSPMIETTCRDNGGAKVMYPGSQTIDIQCTVTNPQELISNIV